MKWLELIIVGLTMAYLYSFLEKKLVERFRITQKHDWHTDSIPKHTNGKRMFQILFFILYIAISFWAFNDQFPLIYWVLLFLTLSQISQFCYTVVLREIYKAVHPYRLFFCLKHFISLANRARSNAFL